MYAILSRLEDFPAQRKPGSGATIQKMTLRQVNRLKKDFNHKAGLSKRQSARKFNISQQRVCQLLQNNGICVNSKKQWLLVLTAKKCSKSKVRKFVPEKSRFYKSGKTLNGHNSIFFKYCEKEKYRF